MNAKGAYKKTMQSNHEKYVVRHSTPPDPSIRWGIPEMGITDLYHYLSPGGPIKESNTMIEFAWIEKDSAFGVTEDKPPHSHECDEIFLFMGTNPKNREELNAEVEFWIGEGKGTEIITLITSGLVFVPKGLVHLPLFFKNVKKPLLWMVIGLNIDETLEDTIKYPVRGI
jgi:hypothetical protein